MLKLLDVVTLTRDLILLPSESSNPTRTDASSPEAAVIQHLKNLTGKEIETELQEALPGRHNVFFRIPQPKRPKLLIIAHMDTVSADGMDQPFAAAVRDNKIWGRGACDDKGPLAAAFACLINLHAEKKSLAYDVTFAGTVDEEVSMAGASALAGHIGGWDLCIALEPTNLKIIRAHKGVYRFLVKTTGKAAHSSIPEQGINALHNMLPIINDIQEFGNELSLHHDPDMGPSFLSFTKINSGTSLNIIPAECTLAVDIRILPEVDPAEIADTIKKIVGKRGTVEDLYSGSGIRSDSTNPLVKAFHQCNVEAGGGSRMITAPFATDCSKIAHAGPCIVWGPGDIAQAHKADEYIEISQLETAYQILRKFLLKHDS